MAEPRHMPVTRSNEEDYRIPSRETTNADRNKKQSLSKTAAKLLDEEWAQHNEEFRKAVEEDLEDARDHIHPQAVEALLAEIPETNGKIQEDKRILATEYMKSWELYTENQQQIQKIRRDLNACTEEQKTLHHLLETDSRISDLVAHENRLIEISKKKAELTHLLARLHVGETAFGHGLLVTFEEIERLAAGTRSTLVPETWDEGRGSGIRRKRQRPSEESVSTGTDDGDFTI